MDKQKINELKIVTIGGGTGNSVLLNSVKEFTSNITAIVSMVDDGGSSGVLRKDLNILPPGDIRACLIALSNTDPLIKEIFSYRFQTGLLENQSLGNLILAATNDICGNIYEASKEMTKILNLTGQVLPVTLDDVVLKARLNNGEIIKGESNIGNRNRYISKIEKVFLEPENITPLPEALNAIREADIICVGPGSLYTSLIPPLLMPEMVESLLETKARVYLISNLVTEKGETDDYTLLDHLIVLENQIGAEIFDGLIVNTEKVSEEVIDNNLKEGRILLFLTEDEKEVILDKGIEIIEGNFISEKDGFIRHEAKFIIEKIIKDFYNAKE